VKGRLNLFQAAMLRWRALHPYNAVHAVRIDGSLDKARLSALIDSELEHLGLTGLTLDATRQRYEYAGGPGHAPLDVVDGGDEPLQALQREIERALNVPFPADGPLVPFRFVAIDARTSFILALTYDHWIAAGDSIVMLMTGLWRAYRAPSQRQPRPLHLYPDTAGRLFRMHAGAMIRGLPRMREMAASARRSMRARYPGGTDPRNGFHYTRLEPSDFAALVRSAKAWGVTVNDMLMAILMHALEPVVGERPSAKRRREIAVASIVNVRRDFGYDALTFGQFLSSFRVAHPLPPGITLQQLARDIHVETARVKDEKLYMQTLIGMAAIGAFWRFLSPAHRQGFHAKHYPAWGAVSTVNVDPLWEAAGGTLPPPEYVRAVPTGPLTPIVVAATTSAGVLHAGISYRTTAFSVADVESIAARIVDRARHLDA
jgi:hypothetical protein